jgi:hypothetical protein
MRRMKPVRRICVPIQTMNLPRISPDQTMPERTSPPSPVPAKGTWIAPRPMWGQLAHLDRRAWIAIGGIAAFGGVAGGVMGMDLPWAATVPTLLMAAAVVSVARMGWGWLRGRSRRARLRESALSRVEAYGGGVYGTGAAMTLLVLSAASFQQEWARSSGVMDFLRGLTFQWWMGFSAESVLNAVWAGLWPFYWWTHRGMIAALAVGAAAWAADALADAWRQRNPAAEVDERAAEAVPAA